MRKFLSIGVLMVAALVLSSCIEFKTVSNVNEDGSGTWEFGFYFDEEAMMGFAEGMGAPAEEGGEDDFTSEMDPGLEEPFTDEATGITFSQEMRDIDGGEWIFVIAEIPDAESWASLEDAFLSLNEEIEAREAEEGGSDTSALEGAPVETDDITGGLIFFPTVTIEDGVMTVVIDAGIPSEAMAGDEGEETEEDPFGDLESFGMSLNDLFTISYEMNLPGEVIDTNGLLDPSTGTLIWELDLTSTEPLEIFAQTSLE